MIRPIGCTYRNTATALSAGFTFGSFGDIITTAQLVWRLARALSDSRGSAPEFQELVKELNHFYGALSELTKFWQSRAQTVELQRLAAQLQHVADDCRRMIESFLENGIKRYAEEQNHVIVSTRLAEIEKTERLVLARLEENLANLVGALKEQEAIPSRMNDKTIAIQSESCAAIYYRAKYGSVALHTCWNKHTLHSMIKDQFKNRPGNDMVLLRDYVLQDPDTTRDLQPAFEFHRSVRPGQKLIMAMVFRGSAHNRLGGCGNSCPKCGLSQMYPGPNEVDKLWVVSHKLPECGLSYREIIDMSEASVDELEDWLRKHGNTKQREYDDADSSPETELADADNLRDILSKRQAMEGPEIFKRVRFLSRWEDRDESRGSLAASLNDIHLWYLNQGEIDFQLKAMAYTRLVPEFRQYKGHVSSWEAGNVVPCAILVGFVGYKRSMSIPVITILCENPLISKVTATVLQELEVVKSSRIRIPVLHPLAVYSEETWQLLLRTARADTELFLEQLCSIEA
ncbi:hypothetical protein PG994_008395 [Apiospora phragmitis]|uniref:Ubiquitin-like domain-containing protein n=1 Tax=Apiospora phragmitis TaxID=2905665 RepID=A0ABR1UW15_9PEZI